MKILLTGGGGAIGRQLLPILLDSGYKVLSISRNEINFTHPNLKKIILDFKNLIIENDLIFYPLSSEIQDLLNSELSDTSCVVHLAGVPSGEGKSWMDYKIGNIDTTKKLVEISELKNIEKFIFSSSASVYGFGNTNSNTETDPLYGNTLYAKSKIEAENIVLNSNINKKVIFRISSVYGKNFKSFINKILNLSNKGIVPQPIKKNNFKSFIYVDDLIHFIKLSIASEGQGIFNISHPELVEFRDLLYLIDSIQNKKTVKIPVFSILVKMEYIIKKYILHNGDSSLRPLFYSSRVDSKKAIENFKYYPKFDIRSGLNNILEKSI